MVSVLLPSQQTALSLLLVLVRLKSGEVDRKLQDSVLLANAHPSKVSHTKCSYAANCYPQNLQGHPTTYERRRQCV